MSRPTLYDAVDISTGFLEYFTEHPLDRKNVLYFRNVLGNVMSCLIACDPAEIEKYPEAITELKTRMEFLRVLIGV